MLAALGAGGSQIQSRWLIHRYVGGFQGLLYHTGQVVLDGVQVPQRPSAGQRTRPPGVSVVLCPVEPAVYDVLDAVAQRAEQRCRRQGRPGHGQGAGGAGPQEPWRWRVEVDMQKRTEAGQRAFVAAEPGPVTDGVMTRPVRTPAGGYRRSTGNWPGWGYESRCRRYWRRPAADHPAADIIDARRGDLPRRPDPLEIAVEQWRYVGGRGAGSAADSGTACWVGPMRKVTAAAGSVLGKGGGLLTGRLLRAISMLPPRQRVCLGPVRRAVACWSYRSRENLGIGQVERPVRGIQPDVGDADLGHGSEELAAQWA